MKTTNRPEGRPVTATGHDTTFDGQLSAWIDRAEVEYQLARELRYPAVADIWRHTRDDLIDLVGADR